MASDDLTVAQIDATAMLQGALMQYVQAFPDAFPAPPGRFDIRFRGMIGTQMPTVATVSVGLTADWIEAPRRTISQAKVRREIAAYLASRERAREAERG
jgi:hypothetical protein